MAIELKTLNLAFRPLSDESPDDGVENIDEDDEDPTKKDGGLDDDDEEEDEGSGDAA